MIWFGVFFFSFSFLGQGAAAPARISEKGLKFIHDEVEKLVPKILSNLTIDQIDYDKDQTHALLGDVQITDFRPPTQILINKATEDRIVATIKDLDLKFKVSWVSRYPGYQGILGIKVSFPIEPIESRWSLTTSNKTIKTTNDKFHRMSMLTKNGK